MAGAPKGRRPARKALTCVQPGPLPSLAGRKNNDGKNPRARKPLLDVEGGSGEKKVTFDETPALRRIA